MEKTSTFPLFKDITCPKCGYLWNSVFRSPMKYRTCPSCKYPIKVNVL